MVEPRYNLDSAPLKWDDYADRMVLAVATPLPPRPVHDDELILMQDSFMSKTMDGEQEIGKKWSIIKVKPTTYGPAFLVATKLSELVRFNESDGTITNRTSAFCASIEYYEAEIGGKHYGVEVQVNGLSVAGGSCHPSSHISVPCAPYLTAFVQHGQAPNYDDYDQKPIEYLTPEKAASIFPEVIFSMNMNADDFVSTCAIAPELRIYDAAGIGIWAGEYLTALKCNHIRRNNPLLVS